MCLSISMAHEGGEKRGGGHLKVTWGRGKAPTMDGDEQHVTCNSSQAPHHKAPFI